MHSSGAARFPHRVRRGAGAGRKLKLRCHSTQATKQYLAEPARSKISELLCQKNCLVETQLRVPGLGSRVKGKVRDTYEYDDKLVIVTTDRLSAFDRVIAVIPCKGQVLNQISAWWFQQTAHLIPNAMVCVPDPNVAVMDKCTVFPVEFVVRGYLTGSTSTSIWKNYQNGSRMYCGHRLPDNLQKNQCLPQNLVTPTTKDATHDALISGEEIVAQGLMTRNEWETAEQAALQIFEFGQAEAAKRGLILVDTKYELGRNAAGEVVLLDEVHTPDSSRYWLADSYQERISDGQEPDNIDKEFIRLWIAENSDPYNDAVLPEASDDMVLELAARYVYLYQRITGLDFEFVADDRPITKRVAQSVAKWVAP